MPIRPGLPMHQPSSPMTSSAHTDLPTAPRPTRRILLLCLLGASALLLRAVSSNNLLDTRIRPGLRTKRDGFQQLALLQPVDNAQQGDYEEDALVHALEAKAADDEQELPTCQRTLLYRFAGVHGFASEYLIFLRVALLARRYGYALFVDDSQWNYGRWEDYFEPLQNGCAAPVDLDDTSRMPIHASPFDPPLLNSWASATAQALAPEWVSSAHVIWSTRRLAYLDDLILSSPSVNQTALEKQHEADLLQFPIKRPLDPTASVPGVFEGIFQDLRGVLLGNGSSSTEGLWKLNREMRDLVSSTKEWTDRLVVAQTGTKRTVIVAHVRLGDKSLELAHYGPQTFPRPPSGSSPALVSAWKQHHKAAKALFSSSTSKHVVVNDTISSAMGPGVISDDAVDAYMSAALGAAQKAGISYDSEYKVKAGDKPVLLIMSDDASGHGLDKLLAHPKAAGFEIITGVQQAKKSSSESLKIKRQIQDRAHHPFASSFRDNIPTPLAPRHRTLHARRSVSPTNTTESSISGFTESLFNALPLTTRVDSTRLFLRDLTVLAKLGDGLVFTGSSNVGRLWTLLAGMNQLEGKENNSNLWSADVRWFPSVRYQ